MKIRAMAPLLMALSGCNLFGTVQASGKSVSEAYGGSHELRVLDVDAPLRREKKIPVLSTPEVLAVYVPAHPERDVLIGDHWIYLRLNDPQWYSERLQQPEPPVTGEAPAESLRPLREADWTKIVIPSKP
ncbi:MAG: hypothetical protein JO332_16395 [Planctomycetaceae bacterium]|nr:hypothetical protein [Planctomycetaceae bacterium]